MRWPTVFSLFEKHLRFLSLHSAHAPAAHITSHLPLCVRVIGTPVFIHSSKVLEAPVGCILCCACMPTQNLVAYVHPHMMWVLVSLLSSEHKWQPLWTVHPLVVRTCCVNILLSNISQTKILTFIGTLIFHSLLYIGEIILELCIIWYADAHEKAPDAVHFQVLAPPVPPVVSVETKQKGIIGIRSLSRNDPSVPLYLRCAAAVIPCSDRIVLVQSPCCPPSSCHIHFANKASFWHARLIMPSPPFSFRAHTLSQLTKQSIPLQTFLPFQRKLLLILSMCFITPTGILKACI